MADATKLPDLTELTYFQWATPDNPNPRLSAPIDDDDTTIYFTAAPKDEDDAVITAPFLMGIKNSEGYVETIYCPNGADGASGLSATGCVRGIDLAGLDYTTNNNSFAASHEQDSPVFCNITAVIQAIMIQAIQGNVASGSSNLIIGTDAAGTVTIKRSTGAGTSVGWLRWNSTGTEVEFSDNGTDWTAMNDVSASVLVKVSSNDTTPGYLNGKMVNGTNTTVQENNDGGDETFQINAAGKLASIVTDVTATAAELNAIASGAGGTVTATNLDTLTDGSDADALHTHLAPSPFPFTSGEAIDGSATPQALCHAGSNYKGEITVHVDGTGGAWDIDQSAFADLAFGDADATTARAQSFTFTDATATITLNRVVLYLKKTAAPADNLTIEIQGNDTDKPDKAVITNGTSNTVAGTSLQTTYQAVEFTWATPPTLTSGTKYWMVLKRSGANDAVNYYSVAYENADNYSSHGNSSYTASTTLWTSQANPDILFHAEFDLDYGDKVYKLDTSDLSKCNFVGFSSDNVGASATIDVIPPGQVQGSFAGLDVATSYYGTATPGTISTSQTDGYDQCSIMVGKSRSATQIFTMDPVKYFIKEIELLDFNATVAAANTVDYCIVTGFKPNKITLTYTRYLDNLGAANNGAFIREVYMGTTKSAADGMIIDNTNNGGLLVTATSVAEGLDSDLLPVVGMSEAYLCVNAVHENGFELRAYMSRSTPYLFNIKIMAEGY